MTLKLDSTDDFDELMDSEAYINEIAE